MAPMVFALAVAARVPPGARRPWPVRARGVVGASLALLLGSIAFSGSRGALAAAFAGLAVYALLVRRPFVLGAAAVLAAATLALSALPSPAEHEPAAADRAGPRTPRRSRLREGYLDANLQGPRLQDDIGHPGVGVADTTRRERTLIGSSGRTEAWRGALGLVADRPLVGYGFGTEDRTFVDRYVFFNSNVPENSYIGILLQLGVVGLVLLLALAAVLVRPALRRAPRGITAAATAAFAAALVLALFQSYLYAAGNAATIVAWVCAFAVVRRGRRRRAREAHRARRRRGAPGRSRCSSQSAPGNANAALTASRRGSARCSTEVGSLDSRRPARLPDLRQLPVPRLRAGAQRLRARALRRRRRPRGRGDRPPGRDARGLEPSRRPVALGGASSTGAR